MKTSTFFTLTALSLLGAYLGFHLVESYINETMIYPPEIIAKPYITLPLPSRNYAGGDWLMGEALKIRFNFERPIIYVDHYSEFGAKTSTQAYDYSLCQIPTTNMQGEQEGADRHLDSNSQDINPGRYGFGYNLKNRAWQYGGEIRDLPENKMLSTPYGSDWIADRDVINYTPNPTIGMKDWSVEFDGKWRNEMGVYATGDNLFGATEKHRLALAFFTGTWTLTVQGKPIFRQRVKNLPIGADFYYSPVYGLVLLSYQGPENKCTLYVIKTPASGPEVYRDLKESQTIIGTRPSDLPRLWQ